MTHRGQSSRIWCTALQVVCVESVCVCVGGKLNEKKCSHDRRKARAARRERATPSPTGTGGEARWPVAALSTVRVGGVRRSN